MRRHVLLLLTLWTQSASAFWGHGHMLVSQIAALTLEASTPNVLRVAEAMVADYGEYFPQTAAFVPAATWSDNLHSEGVYLFRSWHYADAPFAIDGTHPESHTPTNSTWALKQCTDALANRKLSSAWAASFYIRWVEHLLGDLHQPLHNIAQFNKDYPDGQGDRGGNNCIVDVEKSNITNPALNNLHKVFDSVAGLYPNDPFYPPGGPGFTTKYKQLFLSQAQELMETHPISSFNADQIGKINFEAWSKEGYDLAIKYAYLADSPTSEPKFKCYKGVKLVLTPEYIKNVQTVLRRQLALAGYRLAEVLRQKLPVSWVAPSNETRVDMDVEKELKDVLRELYADQHKFDGKDMALAVLISVFFGVFLTLGICWIVKKVRATNSYRVLGSPLEDRDRQI